MNMVTSGEQLTAQGLGGLLCHYKIHPPHPAESTT